MAYECYPVDADYRVVSPGWWGFRGTGLEYDDTVPGLVGPEADRDRPLGERTSRFVKVVTDNVLRTFAEGRVGKRHPARDNVGKFDLPLANSVSAS
jgi:hypothetical protein